MLAIPAIVGVESILTPEYEGRTAAVDGESVCLVKRTDVVDLIEAVHAIVLK